MKTLEVLITNNTLAGYAGSELYVRDVARSLKARGHKPVAYSQVLGRVADDLRAEGIQVAEDLKQVATIPDLIHGQHNLETMTALLHFPNTPAICFCHGYLPWQEQPPIFPRILRYIAVDRACLDRLYESGIHPDRTRLIFNFADLNRFNPRGPLPWRPRRALVFSNYVREDNCVPLLRRACQEAGIDLAVAGESAGRSCYKPELLLPEFDLVFAKGRCAIEALAVGCAVITCGDAGFGSLVTTGNLRSLRELNFGFRTASRPLDLETIAKEIAGYDAQDALEVSRQIRATASMESAIDQLLVIYHEVLAEFGQMSPVREAEEKATAAYLSWLSKLVKGNETKLVQLQDRFKQENEWLKAELEKSVLALAEAKAAHAIAQAGAAQALAQAQAAQAPGMPNPVARQDSTWKIPRGLVKATALLANWWK